MKAEQVPSHDGQIEPQGPEQLDFDFEDAAKEAAVEARAKALRKVKDWTMPHAMNVARAELKKEEWDEKASQKEKSK